jgi:signal peptidase
LFVVTSIVGLEMARAFCFHAWRPYNERAAFFGTAGLFALAMTPYGQLSGLLDTSTLVSVLAGFIVPTIMLSVLLTWLADHGGPAPAMAYVGALASFEWFSQVQPELDWPALFIIGTAGPIISAKLIRDIYLNTAEGETRWAAMDHHHEESGDRHPLAWTIAVAAVVLSVIGVASLLGFRPAVVTGISMEPTFEQGDLAILKRQVDPASLSVGDIVEFRDRFDRPVVHRIVDIQRVEGTLVFTTQGDNNTHPDDLITADQISARVVLLVPEVGHPALWFRS